MPNEENNENNPSENWPGIEQPDGEKEDTVSVSGPDTPTVPDIPPEPRSPLAHPEPHPAAKTGTSRRCPGQPAPQMTFLCEENGKKIQVLSCFPVGNYEMGKLKSEYREFYAREQFKIQYSNGAWMLTPYPGVPNKTFVNGSVVYDPVELKDEDVIAVGNEGTKNTVCPVRVILPQAVCSINPPPQSPAPSTDSPTDATSPDTPVSAETVPEGDKQTEKDDMAPPEDAARQDETGGESAPPSTEKEREVSAAAHEEEKASAGEESADEEDTAAGSIKAIKKAADAGDVDSMFQYGVYLFEHYDYSFSKSPEMVSYLEKAAESHSEALYYLGLIYYYKKGIVVQDNIKKSVDFFKKAADAGVVESQFFLGEIYANGELGYPDLDKARKYWTKAAKQGHEGAKKELKMYPLPPPAGPVFSNTETDISLLKILPACYPTLKKELISSAERELEKVRAWKKDHQINDLPFAWKEKMAPDGGLIMVDPPTDRDIWYVGDTHGDLLAFETAMQYILSQPGNPYIVILGDLIDRQPYSLGIFLRLISLVISHPGRIVWVAGNHDTGLNYDSGALRFRSQTSPAEFAEWLNEHPEYTDLGLFFIEIVKTLPRAIYFGDGLCVVHGGVPGMNELPDIKSFEDLYSSSTLYAYIWNRLIPDRPRRRGGELGWENVKAFLDVASDILDFPVTRILRGHDHCEKDRYLFYDQYEEKANIPVLTFVTLSAWTDSEFRMPEDQKTIATSLNVAHHRPRLLPEIVRLKLDQGIVDAFWQND